MPALDPLIPKFAILAIFLGVHFIASYKKWYYSRPDIDTISHFLGGLTLGAFIQDMGIAIALILIWEFIEMALVNRRWRAFRETPLNKIRDVLLGLLGYVIGFGML